MSPLPNRPAPTTQIDHQPAEKGERLSADNDINPTGITIGRSAVEMQDDLREQARAEAEAKAPARIKTFTGMVTHLPLASPWEGSDVCGKCGKQSALLTRAIDGMRVCEPCNGGDVSAVRMRPCNVCHGSGEVPA